MDKGQTFLLTILVATLLFHGTCALNIDVLSPTVVNSGVTNGNSIGFGFALTQHQFLDGRKSVLVSAPRVDGTFQREGGVYNCPFVNGGNCQFENVFQSKRNVRGVDPFVAQLSSLNVSYIGQLMGYSLRSFENHVVACAPLYIDTLVQIEVFGEMYIRGDPNGRCIILDRNLNETTPIQLFSSDVNSLRVAGVDTGVLRQNSEEKLVFGSVFSGTGSIPSGQVFLTSLHPDTLGTDEISSSVASTSTLPLTGYHVDTGYFTTASTSGTKQIVTSAPRSNLHLGKIDFLNIGTTLDTARSLLGQEIDGYFGYDFAVVNFDPEGTGHDSLVVGCPLCNREKGRVYVYTHTGDINNPFVETIIEAPGTARGRFGLSVENVGDIDLDGISDVAISAPYEGSGVVYVYRGSPSGLVANDPQVIYAQSALSAFGYALSGGADIDDNGYPDITVGDLSGSYVTSYRTSPLVNVTIDLFERKDVLDIVGDADRVCRISENVNVPCFNVTPCFHFDSKFGDVPRFALQYTVLVDGDKGRASLYQVDAESREVSLSGNTYSSSVTVSGPGVGNRMCVEPLFFALSADFMETVPISVRISIDDVQDPLSLDDTLESMQLGGSLHPILQRYLRGDTRLPLSLEHEINFNVECSSGVSPDICEPIYQLSIKEDFANSLSADNILALSAANEFGFLVNVTNSGGDDGLNPSLLVQLPAGVVYNRSVSLSSSAITECVTRSISDSAGSRKSKNLSLFSTNIECFLRNPTLAGLTLELEIFFLLNVSAIPLSKSSLDVVFSVVDGVTGNISESVSKSVELDAVGAYGITSFVAEEKYQAFRSTFYRNSSTIPLNETGPLITFRIVARNTRSATNGTAFPRTTLLIHVPVEVSLADNVRRPLLVLTSIVVTSGNVNCSHYEAVPGGLSVLQQPVGFIPPWTGSRPPMESGCAGTGQYRCGVIMCTIVDLGPSPDPPTQLNIFARLHSPSVLFSGELSIYSQLFNETVLPRQGVDSYTESELTFTIAPAITEVLLECVQYWVVVVSVVIGIIVLVVIISILACCGLFRRWYKSKKSEPISENNGTEQTDSELFYRRTIPPIPGITQGHQSVQLTGYQRTDLDDIDEEKSKEAESEEHALASASPPDDKARSQGETLGILYDPSEGVHDESEAVETDL